MNFNKAMSSARECVEWGFADIVRLWGFLDHSLSHKILHSPVGVHYRIGVFLTNIHICIYGSEMSIYFNCAPPTLEEYLTPKI